MFILKKTIQYTIMKGEFAHFLAGKVKMGFLQCNNLLYQNIPRNWKNIKNEIIHKLTVDCMFILCLFVKNRLIIIQ